MLDALDPAMRRAFELAWQSWGEGNFGIGAVLVDPTTGSIVSEGRNRVASEPTAEQPLGGNYLAHAEMNAFAAMRSYNATGLDLVGTLEPCLMCAASAIFLNVASVRFAAGDEYFAGMHDELWPAHPYSRDRRPPTTGPLDDEAVPGGTTLAAIARLLPLFHTLRTIPDSRPARLATEHHPTLATVAGSVAMRDLWAAAAEIDAAAGIEALSVLLGTVPLDTVPLDETE